MNVTNTTTSVYTVPTTVYTEVIENETTDEVVETQGRYDEVSIPTYGLVEVTDESLQAMGLNMTKDEFEQAVALEIEKLAPGQTYIISNTYEYGSLVVEINNILNEKLNQEVTPYYSNETTGETTFTDTFVISDIIEQLKYSIDNGWIPNDTTTESYGTQYFIETTISAREQITNSINDLFEEYGIVIPEGVEFQLKVDPFDMKIHAVGVDDELAEQIETALNQGENGQMLYNHIQYSDPSYYTQYGYTNVGPEVQSVILNSGTDKEDMYNIIGQYTGYDIRGLEVVDGDYITPSGESLWDVFEEKVAQSGDDVDMESIKSTYKYTANYGFESSISNYLSITYKDGELYDFATNNGWGTGQSDWLVNVYSNYKTDATIEDLTALLEEIAETEETIETEEVETTENLTKQELILSLLEKYDLDSNSNNIGFDFNSLLGRLNSSGLRSLLKSY